MYRVREGQRKRGRDIYIYREREKGREGEREGERDIEREGGRDECSIKKE